MKYGLNKLYIIEPEHKGTIVLFWDALLSNDTSPNKVCNNNNIQKNIRLYLTLFSNLGPKNSKSGKNLLNNDKILKITF